MVYDETRYAYHSRYRLLCQPPVGWESTYCFIDVRVGVRVSVTPIAKGSPAQIFFGNACFLFPKALASSFCYDPLLSRSSGESVFHQNGIFPDFVKNTRGILIKRARKLHRQVAHDLIIVDLQLTYFCIYCVVLKLPIL